MAPLLVLLLLLLVVWAILLLGGFMFGKPDADRTRRMPTWTRLGSSLALALAAWVWCALALTQAHAAAALWLLLIALGMSLGLLGDLFMAGLIRAAQPVLGGIAAFGVGHLAYIAALLGIGQFLGLGAAGTRWGAWGVWLLGGLVGWYLVVWRGHPHTLIHRAALGYVLLLASTAGVATGLGLQASAFMPVAVGAALFLLSDLILAAELFNGLRFPLIGDLVWLTYGPAQVLIVFGTGFALLGHGA
jgi:hypothetical protein